MSKCYCCGAKYNSKGDGCEAGCWFPTCLFCKLCVYHCRCKQPNFSGPGGVVAREEAEAKREGQ